MLASAINRMKGLYGATWLCTRLPDSVIDVLARIGKKLEVNGKQRSMRRVGVKI